MTDQCAVTVRRTGGTTRKQGGESSQSATRTKTGSFKFDFEPEKGAYRSLTTRWQRPPQVLHISAWYQAGDAGRCEQGCARPSELRTSCWLLFSRLLSTRAAGRAPRLPSHCSSNRVRGSMPSKKPFTFSPNQLSHPSGNKGGCKPSKTVAKASRSDGDSEHRKQQRPAPAPSHAVAHLQRQVDLSAHPVSASLMVANDERQLQCTRALLGHANQLRQSLIDLQLIVATMTVESTAASSTTAASHFLVHMSEQTRGQCAGTAV